MTDRWKPTNQHRTDAVRRVLAGLAQGQDVLELQGALADLHPRDNTFPGEVLLRLARDALYVAGITQAEPIPTRE